MKRYNLCLVEQDTKKIVHEIKLIYSTPYINEDVFIDNPIHTTFIELENAIAKENKNV
ncbi:hypothetical protein LCGC14_0947200 [marine sediment metagenome]|uniref:Uncharacterized protein n=1 Tax=marine sediment metagenome TaxID=412755 RepID=A0A0F9R1Z2_9ZZZZ